jgi:hypothetical protein
MLYNRDVLGAEWGQTYTDTWTILIVHISLVMSSCIRLPMCR